MWIYHLYVDHKTGELPRTTIMDSSSYNLHSKCMKQISHVVTDCNKMQLIHRKLQRVLFYIAGKRSCLKK
jgi:hypothetical protein